MASLTSIPTQPWSHRLHTPAMSTPRYTGGASACRPSRRFATCPRAQAGPGAGARESCRQWRWQRRRCQLCRRGSSEWSANITQPKSQGASQAMLYGVGLTEEDMNKPQVHHPPSLPAGTPELCHPLCSACCISAVMQYTAMSRLTLISGTP